MTEKEMIKRKTSSRYSWLCDYKYSGACINPKCKEIVYARDLRASIMCSCSARCRGPFTKSYKGGRVSCGGYIFLSGMWSHPRANSQGAIGEHILIMEKHLGRYIHKNERVHHKNGIKNDNRLCNLELMVHHTYGQRVEDVVAFAVDDYPELVIARLKAKRLIP